MFKKLFRPAVTAGALVAAAAVAFTAAPATAAVASVSNARISVHFNFSKGQTPENVALEPDGDAYVSFAEGRQIAEVTRKGTTRILATLSEPNDGGVHTPATGRPLTTGIVRADDGTLYFLYVTGTADLTGLWRLRPGGEPQRIAALPANAFPDGLAVDARNHTLYITDCVLSTVWSVPTYGGTPTAWLTAPELAPTGFLGANGLKIHNGAVWVTNLDKGTVLRIPILRDGRAGELRTIATGMPGIDDFAFTGPGDQILAALNPDSEVVLVEPDGSHSIVLTSADGLQNPTSIALRGDTVYVLSAAYFTAKEPNLILAHLAR